MILCVCANPSIDCYAWLEDFKPGGVNRIDRLKQFPGGKATHIALALNAMSIESELLAIWGGTTGQWIKKTCEEEGIATSGIDLDENSRKCYTFRSKNPKIKNTEILEPGPHCTDENWTDFLKILKSRASRAELVCISGSLPAGCPDDGYRQMIDVCSSIGIRTIIDCSGVQLENALKTTFYGLHINQDETQQLGEDVMAVAKRLQETIQLIALTNGKKGLSLFYGKDAVHANVKIENIKSTVGAGDCLTAGIAFGVSQNKTIEDIARLGAACGAANCLNEDLGLLNRKDVEGLLKKVKTKTLYSAA